MWSVFSLVAWRAASIKVRGGIISILSDAAQPESGIVLELSGMGVLGPVGALQFSRILSETASSKLNILDLR